MSIDLGHLAFLVWFFGGLVGTLLYSVLLTVLHLSRPHVFDGKFLKTPHFTEKEILYGTTGGVMSVLLTKLVCLIILFPNRKQYRWRNLGGVVRGVPFWYKCFSVVYYLTLFTTIVIVVGILVGFQISEWFVA